jgi:chitodextrinase
MLSHTQLAEGQSGTDNWGKPVSFGQTLWYALGSFLLTKNDTLGNAYFMFQGASDFNRIQWFEEYDKIDLGKALGAYRVASIGGVNVYSREFERGYVYVNPTPNNVSSITLPQASRLLTRDTLDSPLEALPLVSTIALNAHHAAFLLKTLDAPAADTSAPAVPTGLIGVAVSSSQINLSWNASPDNVGVMGYYVYLNDVTLAITTATSFTHSGLAAGTTYKYRVSAYDTVPNHSAWTATPVAVTTPTPPDTTAPAVPTGLIGVAVSSSQINLSWNASTDNAGVTGYYVYLNDKPLATTTATSFTHSGLTAGTTHKYRVSAYDAVPNHSAWTTPLAVTTSGGAVSP